MHWAGLRSPDTLPCLRLFINPVTGRHILTPCVPPSHVVGRDKESRHLTLMNSHPTQHPGQERKPEKSGRRSRKVWEGNFPNTECVLKPS